MKKYAIVLFLIVILSIVGYCYFFKPQRNISAEDASFSVTSKILVDELKKGDVYFNNKYLDKTLTISGLVSNIDKKNNAFEIDENIFATTTSSLPLTITLNQKIAIKARFIGYDDLLELFKFDQASLPN